MEAQNEERETLLTNSNQKNRRNIFATFNELVKYGNSKTVIKMNKNIQKYALFRQEGLKLINLEHILIYPMYNFSQSSF